MPTKSGIEVIEQGAHAVLAKPFDAREIVAVIRQVSGTH
jgi:DNA-binding response OmpR family regulator